MPVVPRAVRDAMRGVVYWEVSVLGEGQVPEVLARRPAPLFSAAA